MGQAPLTLLLLAYNAEADLDEVVAAWDGYLASLGRPYEILLVNDGSTDNTAARAEALRATYPHLRIEHHPQHTGIGTSLRTGAQHARHPLLVTAPCDKQFHPPDLYRVLESIDQVDLVIGYRVGPSVPGWLRFVDGVGQVFARIFLGSLPEPRESWVGWSGWRRRWAARWLFGLRVQDPECPFRLYRRTLFDRFPVQSDSSAAQIEILAKANHLECVMAEVPVSWVPLKDAPVAPTERNVKRELRRLFSNPEFTFQTPPLTKGGLGGGAAGDEPPPIP